VTIAEVPEGVDSEHWLLHNIQHEHGSNVHVWMSHGDSVVTLPTHSMPFYVMASSLRCPIAAYACPSLRLYGLQFHPEVTHRCVFLSKKREIEKKLTHFISSHFLHI
jgi:GMP synthase (glutamine-hydrolysing)